MSRKSIKDSKPRNDTMPGSVTREPNQIVPGDSRARVPKMFPGIASREFPVGGGQPEDSVSIIGWRRDVNHMFSNFQQIQGVSHRPTPTPTPIYTMSDELYPQIT